MTTGKFAARRDAAVIAVISLAAAVLCVKLDLSEALLGWTRQHERLQLDELPAVLLVVASCLIWFSSRRYFEARRQLVLRRATEAALAASLAENQRLAQQSVDLREMERKALARDLHDDLCQYLNVIKLDAVSIRDAPQPGDPVIGAAARAMIDNVDRLYGVVTGLIRQLRPAGLDELGVAAAIEHCVNDWRARLPGTVIDLVIDATLADLDELRSLTLFRLVQEALTNVARHARADRVGIRIGRRRPTAVQELIDVVIVDDGRGVGAGDGHAETGPRAGLGLIGMRERVAALGGSLTFASRPGEGFRIAAALPVAPDPDPDPDPDRAP